MAATREYIQECFIDGVTQRATHMLIVCDMYDYEDYPVYVKPGESVNEKVIQFHGPNMQKVMEVYRLADDMNEQLREHRCWRNW